MERIMIEVGDFVRTKQGKIAKLIEVSKNNYYWFDNWIYKESGIPHQGFRIEDTERIGIVKHSKIISEVVEVGDYVNGKRIHKIDKGENYCYLYYGNCKTFVNYQIKTILTKEMYESNCYTVERKEEC